MLLFVLEEQEHGYLLTNSKDLIIGFFTHINWGFVCSRILKKQMLLGQLLKQ